MDSPDIDVAERREELRLSILTVAIYAVIGVQLPFYPLWLNSRGLGPSEIAAVMAAPPAFRILSTLIASRQGDRSGRHAAILVTLAFCAGLSYFLMGFMHGFAPILAAVVLLAATQGPVGILADGVILGAAQRRRAAERPALHYSYVRGWGSVSILVFMLACGPVARALPNSDLVWLLAGVSFAAAALAFFALRGVAAIDPSDQICAHMQRLARPQLVAGVIVATALIQSSHAFVLAFGALHWKALGYDENFVSLAWAAALVTEVGFFLAAGRWFGGESRAVTHLLLGGAAAVLRWTLMALDPGTLGIVAAQALHGLSCAAVQLGPAYLLARLCGPGRSAQAQGWLAAANAATLGVATFASGQIYASFGERSYLAMAAMAGLGFGLALLVGRALQDRAVGADVDVAALESEQT